MSLALSIRQYFPESENFLRTKLYELFYPFIRKTAISSHYEYVLRHYFKCYFSYRQSRAHTSFLGLPQ